MSSACSRAFLFLIVAVVLVGEGCGDSSTKPGNLALSNLWPNEDGRRWEYVLTAKGWVPDVLDSTYIFPDSSDAPASPGFDEIIPLIDSAVLPDTFAALTTEYAMEFQGTVTTVPFNSDEPGVKAQNLLEYEGDVPIDFGCIEESNPLLVMLAAARPDLRPRLGVSPQSVREIMAPVMDVDTYHLMIHGGPWERTKDHIGTYGCLDAQLAWKFLEADNAPGSQFTFRLLPSLAFDVFLRARVRRRVDFETPAGLAKDALDVVYIIDYGLSQDTDAGSNVTGVFRYISFGNVIYAPAVGPIYSYERNLVPVGRDTLGTGLGEVVLELEKVIPGDLNP